MKKLSIYIIFISLTAIYLLLNTGRAHAETISLSTYPSTILLHAEPPADARSGFRIENKSRTSVKLNIMLQPFKADPTQEGKISYNTGTNPPILKQIQIIDNGIAVSSIELGPKQSKNLNLRVAISENEQAADYYFSVIFMADEPVIPDENTEDVTARSYAQTGIAVNVLLNVGPDVLPRGYLEEFSTDSFRTAGPVPFRVKIKNNGIHYFTPKGVILIKNIFGQTVGRIDLQNANILAGTSRLMIGKPFQQSAKNTQSTPLGNKIKDDSITSAAAMQPDQTAVWPEKFLLGLYKAELSIALSEEGPLFTQTITFLALPTNILLGIVVIIVLFSFIFFRIRKKLRES